MDGVEQSCTPPARRTLSGGHHSLSRVRVLHIGKYYPPVPGGIEHFLADLLGALERIGLETAALVHQDRPRQRGVHLVSAARPLIYRAPTLGQVLYAPVSPSFPLWMRRAITELQPQILHFHLPNTSAFSALALQSARRLPWVVHWHADVGGSTIDRRLALAYRLYRPLEQCLLAKSQVVIATSPPYLEASTALRPWLDRCTSVPVGLDIDRLPLPDDWQRRDAEQQWGKTDLRVLAVGRLTYYKGHDVLIDAVERVPQARVMIVGGGDNKARLETRIRSLSIQHQVILTGLVPQERLAALISTCDVLCLPSLERTEAFGLVLLEAMRFGKPVVVSDIPGSGTGWVVRQAGNGVLTKPGDAASIADALRYLWRAPEQRRVFGDRGRKALESYFGIDQIAESVAEVYARILGTSET